MSLFTPGKHGFTILGQKEKEKQKENEKENNNKKSL